MSLYQILVPSQHKNGSEILPVYHDVWLEKITEITGGVTFMPDAKGTWTTPNGIVFEHMTPALISCSSEQLDYIVDFTLEYYQQDAVFAFKMTDDIIIRCAKTKVVEFKK